MIQQLSLIKNVYEFYNFYRPKSLLIILLGAGIITIITYYGFNIIRAILKKQQYKREIRLNKKRIQLKNEALKARLNIDGILLTKNRLDILNHSLEKIIQLLKEDHYSPLQVLQAYQAKALEVNANTNCICEYIEEADKWAIALSGLAQDKRGPFFGLPISVKESYNINGYDTTHGLAKYIGKNAKQDCSFIQRLKELGAVPFCLTNVPQTLMTFGSSNPVFGVTTNPYNRKRTAGGSSSGEGALIGAGGSLLGIGSDIGGSLRIPAHFCGILSLKPTAHRLMDGSLKACTKMKIIGIDICTGFMSNSVYGIKLGMSAILKEPEKAVNLDFSMVPIPWNETVFKLRPKLKIGWYDDDGLFSVTPGCCRAVAEAVDMLTDRGHEAIPYKFPNFSKNIELYMKMVFADGGVVWRLNMDGEIVDQVLATNWLLQMIPQWMKTYVVGPLLSLISPFVSKYACLKADLLSQNLMKSMFELEAYIQEVIDHWNKVGIDVVICPGFVCPAPKYENVGKITGAVVATAVFNVLNFPVGAVPITKENNRDQIELDKNYAVKDMMAKLIATDTKGAIGLPIGVQVVAKPWKEELVVFVMEELENARNKKLL